MVIISKKENQIASRKLYLLRNGPLSEFDPLVGWIRVAKMKVQQRGRPTFLSLSISFYNIAHIIQSPWFIIKERVLINIIVHLTIVKSSSFNVEMKNSYNSEQE